jgi:hypothetical protein
MMITTYKHSTIISSSYKCVMLQHTVKIISTQQPITNNSFKLLLNLTSIVFIKTNFISLNNILLTKKDLSYVTVETESYAENSPAQLKNLQ